MTIADKRHLTDAQIEAIRARYRVESRVDECLTWKLRRRRGPDYRLPPLDEIAERLQRWLGEVCGEAVQVAALKRLPGGASKEMFTFQLRRGAQIRPLVLRMSPGESVVETHRLREFQVMKALKDEVPVPEMLWVDAEGSRMGQSALVCGFVGGATKPSRPVGGGTVSGIGVGFPSGLREAIAAQFVAYLGAIHQFDWRSAELSAFDVPTPGTREAVQWNLDSWRRIWEEDALEEHPVISLAACWLIAHAPVCDDVRLVHNDYRNGNFLFDESSRRITAILDWELAHLADVHEDLAWVLFPGFSSVSETGERLACGLASREQFLADYERLSGIRPDPEKLVYYEIFNTFKLAVLGTATTARAAADRQSHLDTMMAFSTGLGYATLPLLAAQLRQVGAL